MNGIEAEGGNKNVRSWGNFLDKTATGIATTGSPPWARSTASSRLTAAN